MEAKKFVNLYILYDPARQTQIKSNAMRVLDKLSQDERLALREYADYLQAVEMTNILAGNPLNPADVYSTILAQGMVQAFNVIGTHLQFPEAIARQVQEDGDNV